MWRLTREVRFGLTREIVDFHASPRTPNRYAGDPPLDGIGHYFVVQTTVRGTLDPHSGYLINIKRIDDATRDKLVPLFHRAIQQNTFGAGGRVLLDAMRQMSDTLPQAGIEQMRLWLSPQLSLRASLSEIPMIKLSQRFEFSASHRLHNPAMTDAENLKIFGKCSNPHGHGHNYQVEVTVAGEPDSLGRIVDLPEMEHIVSEDAITLLDHKNLNVEVPQFAQLNPTVENIAKVIWQLLKPRLARLSAVTVWETPKTWCEYSQ